MTVQMNEPFAERRNTGTKLVAGAFLLLLGLLLTADNFALIDADHYLRWWSLVLVVLGAMKLAEPGGRAVGAILLLVGLWLLAYNLRVIDFTIFDLWPLVLIAIGVGMLARGFRGEASPGSVPGEAASSGWAVLSTRRIRPVGPFAGGRVGALLGTCELDLTAATVDQPPAAIEAIAFWGEVKILVPEGWTVTGEVLPIMAGFEMKTGPASDPKNRVVVRGFAMMAGISVRHPERSRA